jgi:ElaB/YqjD/DUF883 family membrane-anchored ribosome-binding protein
MHHSTLKTHSDLRSAVEDVQEMFHEAASTTGEKAEDLRNKGLEMLDSSISKIQEVQATAVETGKEIAASTDKYLQENLWRTIAISAGIGMLIGIAISRK